MTDSGRPLLHHQLDDFTEPWREPDADVVLLHPGLGGNVRLYRPWVPLLADRYRVLRVTARGHAGSPRPPGYQWSLDSFLADVIELLDHLQLDRVHWVGASGGGIIGQYAALTQPDRIASLTLVATTARFRGPLENYDEWLAPLDRGDVAGFFAGDLQRRFGTDDPARTAWIINELERTSGPILAELHRWVHGVDLTDRLPEIVCPTLVVTGEQDTLTDLDDANLLARRIPDARLEVLPDRPHNIAYTHPHEVARLVRSFLDEIAR